jgi:hypothetical protein
MANIHTLIFLPQSGIVDDQLAVSQTGNQYKLASGRKWSCPEKPGWDCAECAKESVN